MSNKIKVLEHGSVKKINFTIRYFVFDPKKHFIGTDIAKDVCRTEMHCSKKKMNEEYDSIYGVWMKIGRGKNTHIEFNKSTKTAANIIFIIPKKHKREALKVLNQMELPWDNEEVKKAFKYSIK